MASSNDQSHVHEVFGVAFGGLKLVSQKETTFPCDYRYKLIKTSFPERTTFSM